MKHLCTLLLLMSLTSCSRSEPAHGSTDTTIYPGIGISGVCEVGMTLRQLMESGRPVSSYMVDDTWLPWARWKNGRFALVPSLGAIMFLGRNEPCSILEFHTVPYHSTTIPGLEVVTPFRGTVSPGVTFLDSTVTKKDIETAFGRIELVVTSSPMPYLRNRTPVSWTHDPYEESWYPNHGIAFVFESNKVTRIKVFKEMESPIQP